MKKFNEMTTQDFAEAIKHNEDFAGKLEYIALEDAEIWINEYLCNFPGYYEISDYGYSYIRIDENAEFSNWYEAVQYDYCLFNPEDAEALEAFIKTCERWENGEYESDEEEMALEDRIEKLKEEAEKVILRRMKSEYDGIYDTGVLLDFVDYWVERNFGDDTENIYLHDDYTFVEHVPRRVVEAHEVKII